VGVLKLAELYQQEAKRRREHALEREEREAIQAEDSPEPSGVDLEPVVTGWPAPLEPDALHGLAGDVVRTLGPHTEADPTAILFQTLTAFGSAVGGRPFFRTEADRQTGNLYAVLVGETSRSRKGTSFGHVRRLLSIADLDWETGRIASGLSSGEGLVWCVRDAIEEQQPVKKNGRVEDYQTVVTDPGISDKRLLVYQSEFAAALRVLGREGNTLSPMLRESWDSGNLRTLTKNSPAKATGAHISVVGHITRAELLRYFDSTEAANGFGNRILWVCVRRSRCLPEGGNLDLREVGTLAGRFASALRFGRETDELKRDEQARAAWIEVYPDLTAGLPGLLGAVTARAEAQVTRLALLYALLDESAVVRAEHLKAGLAAWYFAEESARFIFGESLGDPVADAILPALRETEVGLIRTEIFDLFKRHRKASEIERALKVLLELGLVERREERSGGRTAERWIAR
jgi:hypothetical protein